MKKRFIAIFLCAMLVMTAALVSCGGSENETSAPAQSEAPVEASSEAPVEASSEAPVEESSEAPVEESSEAPVEESSEAPVEESSEPEEESSEEPFEEPEGYLWLKADEDSTAPGINFKVPGDDLVDDVITVKALVYFGEDCVSNGGCVYLNCYSYEKDEFNNWDYLINFIDYAKDSTVPACEWTEVEYTFNPFDGQYGSHSGSKYTPAMLSMGVGFYLATGTIKVAYMSVEQHDEEIWYIDFTNGFDVTDNDDLEKVCEGGLVNMDLDNYDINWGTVGATITVDIIDSPIVGKWVLKQEIEGMEIESSYDFKADGKLVISILGIDMEADYTVDGENVTITVTDGEESQSKTGTFAIDGDTITLTFDGESQDFTRAD